MSLVTVSEKRNRTYARAFDHDECKRLRALGWSYPKLAAYFAVSEAGVARVCDAKTRERMDAYTAQYLRDKREPCKGGCGVLVWTHMKNRSGYCPACAAALIAAPNVRDNELRCTRCGEWKPDEDFYKASGKCLARRGRKTACKSCDNAARRGHRRRTADASRAYDRNRKREDMPVSRYAVLVKTGEGTWKEHSRDIEAPSRMAAVEKVADGPGVYAAMTDGQLSELPVEERQAFKVIGTLGRG